MNSNYSINSGKPAFAVADDDMENAFLQSSGGRYLASDRLGGAAPKPYTSKPYDSTPSPDEQYQTTIQQIQDVEQRTLDSTKRSLQAIAESEQVGVETAKDLVHQREQLQNTNKRLDTINADLKESEKNINAIKSVFSSFRQWMTTPKGGKSKEISKEISATSPTADKDDYKEPCFDHNPKLEKAVNIAPQYPHPSLKLRDVDYSSESSGAGQQRRYDGASSNGSSDDWRETTRRVNTQLDTDLGEMSFGLSRLRGLAEGLGQEITDQNSLLDTISTKADKTDITLVSTNKKINTILKK